MNGHDLKPNERPPFGCCLLIWGNDRQRTGRTLLRPCPVEGAKALHHQEIGGLWRCASCGHAESEHEQG